MITCPDCDGKKKVMAFVDGVTNVRRRGRQEAVNCFTCHGAGELTEEAGARIADGRARRRGRQDRGLSLRQEAARLGIDERALNLVEFGRMSAAEAGI